MGSRLVLLLCASACAPASADEPWLDLLSFRQQAVQIVALNEPLDFHFSAELDEASLTADTLRVFDPERKRVRGSTGVHGKKLTFLPELPTTHTLDDGSLRPGTDYTVEILGFPFPDGLRGLKGELLQEAFLGSFRTVTLGEGVRTFLDLDPEVIQVPIGGGAEELRIGPLEPLRLFAPVPLDPSTLFGEDFRLRRVREEPEPELVLVPSRVRLAENTRAGAWLELRPEGPSEDLVPAFEPGEYYLDVGVREGGPRLRAMGGQPTLFPTRLIGFRVAGPRVELLREEFTDARRRTLDRVARTDGSADWSDGGAVRLRYPLAAGSGAAGEVELAGPGTEHDVSATRLHVPAGERCDLPSDGLCVLRAQADLVIDGLLRRRVETGETAWPEGESAESWQRRTRVLRGGWTVRSLRPLFRRSAPALPPREEWATLSAWLAEAAAEDAGWTVLVAGGDLVVRGAIEVDGPLVLVAGGTLRLEGPVTARELWRPVDVRVSPEARLEVTPLRLDEPEGENPLRIPLRVAVLSDWIRPGRGVRRWRAARVGLDPGAGTASVRFQGQRATPAGELRSFGPVDDVSLLEDCLAVRFLVELELGPGPRWAPPSVDWVELSWDESP